MIETRYLYYFLAVARELNITKAAESLHITQPTLSKQMMDLEDMLGCALFERNRKKLELTREGLYLQARAQEILELMEKTEAELTNRNEEISGEINLGAAETPLIEEVIEVFHRLKEEYPGIRLNIYSGDADLIMERLDNGLADIGLILSPRKSDRYNYCSTKYADELALVMNTDDPLAAMDRIPLEKLYELPLVMSRRISSGRSSVTENLDREKLNVVSTYNLAYNGSFMVKSGIGYGLSLAGMREDKDLAYRGFEPPLKHDAFIVTRKYQTFSPAAKVFMERLIKHFGEKL